MYLGMLPDEAREQRRSESGIRAVPCVNSERRFAIAKNPAEDEWYSLHLPRQLG